MNPSDADPAPRLGPEFHKLWTASAASNLADGMTFIAGPLLAASLTRDPVHVAGLAFAERLPWLLFPLISGALADRLDRRRIMAAVAAFRALLIGLVGAALLLDAASLALLYVVFFLLGAGETLFDISATALLPSVVSKAALPKANARLTSAITLADQFIGKPVGGFLFATAAALPFLASGAGLAAAGALLLSLRGSFKAEPQPEARPDLRAEIAEGLRWLSRHRLLRVLAVVEATGDLTMTAWVSIQVLWAVERLGLDSAGYGVLVAMYGVGGLFASGMAERIRSQLGVAWALRMALLFECALPAALALTTNPIIADGVYVIFGFHAVVYGVVLTSLRQELTPPYLLGRVDSVYKLIDKGAAAPGALAGGFLAAHFGITAPFWLHAGAMAFVIVIVWPAFSRSRIADFRRSLHP